MKYLILGMLLMGTTLAHGMQRTLRRYDTQASMANQEITTPEKIRQGRFKNWLQNISMRCAACWSCCFRKKSMEIELVELPDVRPASKLNSFSIYIEPSRDTLSLPKSRQDVSPKSPLYTNPVSIATLPGVIQESSLKAETDMHDLDYEFVERDI